MREEKKEEGRAGLLGEIRRGRALKKVDPTAAKPPPKEESTTIGGVFDVSAMLKKSLDMRRNAAGDSDSDDDDSDSEDWD